VPNPKTAADRPKGKGKGGGEGPPPMRKGKGKGGKGKGKEGFKRKVRVQQGRWGGGRDVSE